MKVTIAGYTTDREHFSKGPESIPAAYAKISRSHKTLPELRKDAITNLEDSRRLNKQVTFEYSHTSIAEHAVFNIDFEDISRYAAEIIETVPFTSPTERSQRYVDILESDFYNGHAFDNILGLYNKYNRKTVNKYKRLVVNLSERFKNEGLADQQAHRKAIENARYVLPMSTLTSVGMTCNSLTVERMIRILKAQDTEETTKIANQLEEAAKEIAPSLINYTTPTAFEKANATSKINRIVMHSYLKYYNDNNDYIDDMIESRSGTNEVIILQNNQLPTEILEILTMKDPHSLTAISEIGGQVVALIKMSNACYSQFKRHRTVNKIWVNSRGTYLPEYFDRNYIADIYTEVQEGFSKIVEESIFSPFDTEPGLYFRTNSHTRIVLATFSIGSLIHYLRLRTSKHAQDEIRNISIKLKELMLENLTKEQKNYWNRILSFENK